MTSALHQELGIYENRHFTSWTDFCSFLFNITQCIFPMTPSFLLQVVFEGIVGTNYRSDIAIDDVSFTSGACAAPGTVLFYFILYSETQCISKLDKIGIFIDMKFH